MLNDKERNEIHMLMEVEGNRAVMHRILSRTRVFGGAVWPDEPQGRMEKMAANVGLYEFGREMVREFKEASPVNYQRMMNEAYTAELEARVKA